MESSDSEAVGVASGGGSTWPLLRSSMALRLTSVDRGTVVRLGLRQKDGLGVSERPEVTGKCSTECTQVGVKR